MWRGDDGRLHTVALPDPREAFTGAALSAIEQLLARARHEEVADLLERHETAVVDHWDAEPFQKEAEADFSDVSVPAGLFDRLVASLPELEAALTSIDPRWGLDVTLAVRDLADAA